MKTVRGIPGVPHEGPRNIIQSSGEEYVSPNFHYLVTECTKKVDYDKSNIYDQYFIKNVKEFPGKPSECPTTTVQYSGEKKCRPNFIIFCAK